MPEIIITPADCIGNGDGVDRSVQLNECAILSCPSHVEGMTGTMLECGIWL